jgi:hypothetical protein
VRKTLQSGCFELARQRLVCTGGRRNPVREAGVPRNAFSCTRMQHLTMSRAQVGVDGGPIERMSEGQLRCDHALAHQPGLDGRIDGIECVR